MLGTHDFPQLLIMPLALLKLQRNIKTAAVKTVILHFQFTET